MAMTRFTVWSVSVGKHTQDSFPSDRLRQLVRTVLVSSARLSCLEPSQWLWAQAAFRSLNPPFLSLYTPWPPPSPVPPFRLAKWSWAVTSDSALQLALNQVTQGGDELAFPLGECRCTRALCHPLQGTRSQVPNPTNQNSSPFALETNQQAH